jgi:hypothetical protein
MEWDGLLRLTFQHRGWLGAFKQNFSSYFTLGLEKPENIFSSFTARAKVIPSKVRKYNEQ